MPARRRGAQGATRRHGMATVAAGRDCKGGGGFNRKQGEEKRRLGIVPGGGNLEQMGFWGQLGTMMQRLREDFFRRGCGGRFGRAGAACSAPSRSADREGVQGYRESQRKKGKDKIADGDDVLIKISGDEYEALTTPEEGIEPITIQYSMRCSRRWRRRSRSRKS